MIRNISMLIIGTLLIFGVPFLIDFNLPKEFDWVAAVFFIYGMAMTKFLALLWSEESPAEEYRCKSCRSGYNGRNGMGYQPCACKSESPGKRPPPSPAPPLTEGSMKSNMKLPKSKAHERYLPGEVRLPKYEEDVREEFDDDEYAIRPYQEH